MSVTDTGISAITGALSGDAGPDVTPGSVAAWALSFHQDHAGDLGDTLLTVGSDTYDGTISATLPEDLSGGSYDVVIEGMTDEDYAQIHLGPGDALAARLHLWWKDSPSGVLGDLASFTGFTDPLGALTPKPPEHSLVAVLRVDRVSRRAGERRYEAVLSLRERVVARLGSTRVPGLCYDSLDGAISAVGSAAGITITAHDVSSATPGPNEPSWASVNPGTALAALQDEHSLTEHGLLGQVRDGLRLYGPKAALIRDGVLHVGRWNEHPLPSRTVDEDTGLVAVQRGPAKARDTAAGDPPSGAPTARDTLTITALGRPDIKPGDTVKVRLPPEDFPDTSPSSTGAALLTAATGFVTGSFTDEPAGPPKTCLAGTVSHRLSRRAGFVTTVHAVVLTSDSDHGWDQAAPAARPAPAREQRPRGAVPPDTAHAAARAIRDVFLDVTGRVVNRVAQIRSHPASTATGQTPPRHTSVAWYADVAGDGMPAGAQRVPITPEHHGEAREVPYLSPFAWGHYGLVLPRYPGTRVMLTSAGGASDFVDIGALWARDAGPPSEAGDYWLVLPVGVSAREDIGTGDGSAQDGPATHDLIDGDGARVIETKRFVVRVTDQPTTCTARPEPGNDAPDGSVLIEAKSESSAAQIVLREDGSITVKGTAITFDTSGHGDITLKADNVKVNVSGTMDVS